MNKHHETQRSTDIKENGEELPELIIHNQLDIVNQGNKSTLSRQIGIKSLTSNYRR